MKWFRAHYLNGDHEITDWRASPILSDRLDRLPPTFIVTASLDPLCDEGEAYARALEAASVRVVHRLAKGQMHGFAALIGIIRAAETVIAETGDFLRRSWS